MSTSKLAAMALLLAPLTLAGQEPGDSVRIAFASQAISPIEGLLVSAGDRLQVTTKSGSVSVSASEAQRIDVYRGTRGNAGKGFIIGASVGAAGGAMMGFAYGGPLAGALVMAWPAGAIGALLGWVSRSPVWEPVGALGESRVTAVPTVSPRTGALGVGVSVAVR